MTYISILPSTLITKGYHRSCIVDVEKSLYCLVPNKFTAVFDICETVEYIKLDDDDKAFADFLVANKFAIATEFKIDFEYYYDKPLELPYSLFTIILDSRGYSDIRRKIDFIAEIPHTVQVRLFYQPAVTELEAILQKLEDKGIPTVELTFRHNPGNHTEDYVVLFNTFDSLSRMGIMGYEDRVIIANKVFAFSADLVDEKQCGIVSEKLFVTNIQSTQLSKTCNSCLYKKLSVDVNGNVRNCPSLAESLGHFETDTFSSIMQNQELKKYWHISKDKIDQCKDCEFRNICTDCRAYITEPGNSYSKPLKCGYNPYSNTWAEWKKIEGNAAVWHYYNVRDTE